MIENKLKQLFDYQQFEKNEKLEKLIKETENRFALELSDDDLEFVAAAGTKEADEQILSMSGKNYAKDVLDNIPPGNSPIVLFDEEK